MTQARDLGDAANKANFLDNVSSDIQTQVTANILPAGLILPFGNTTAPTGYLACDGSMVSKSTYADLWNAIGTAWGSATSTHFKLPDLRGAFLRGTGSNATHNMANGNDFAGPSVGSFENDQLQGHHHTTNFPNHARSVAGAGSNFVFAAGVSGSSHGILEVQNASTDSTNGTPRTGDETRPFGAGVLYCIKT